MSNASSSPSWIKRTIFLKQDLMLSPLEYEIKYGRPGTEFDEVWMQAEDDRGLMSPESCRSRTVLVCRFPALYQHPSTTAEAAMTKRFFVSHEPHLDSANPDTRLVVKAAVWLQDEVAAETNTLGGSTVSRL